MERASALLLREWAVPLPTDVDWLSSGHLYRLDPTGETPVHRSGRGFTVLCRVVRDSGVLDPQWFHGGVRQTSHFLRTTSGWTTR